MAEDMMETGYCFSGWPPRPIFSLYDWDGTLLHRARSANFDLFEAMRLNQVDFGGFVRFGMSSESSVRRRWTLDEMLRQEENIRYDLSEDGISVNMNRVKGVGLSQKEELLWEFYIH
jgi:hypothetical protein